MSITVITYGDNFIVLVKEKHISHERRQKRFPMGMKKMRRFMDTSGPVKIC